MVEQLNHPLPRVLIVEDEQRLRELLSRAISSWGFEVSAVRSAEEALKLLSGQPADIGLLDLNLPGRGGIELFEDIHRLWPRMQVIVLTGFGDLESAKQAIRLDVVDFLTKPCHLGELEVALDRASRRLPRGQVLVEITPQPTTVTTDGSTETLEDIERRHILEALERNNGNRTATAEELGISRRTLQYRLQEYQQKGIWKEEE